LPSSVAAGAMGLAATMLRIRTRREQAARVWSAIIQKLLVKHLM
jgi:hypothetical protein